MSKYGLQHAKVLGRVFSRLSEPKRRHLDMAFDEADKSDFGDFASKVIGILTPLLSASELQAVADAIDEVIGGEGAQDEGPDGFVGPGSSNARAARREGYLKTFSQEGSQAAMDSARRDYAAHFPGAAKIALDDNFGKQAAPSGLNRRAAKSASISDYAEQFGAPARKV